MVAAGMIPFHRCWLALGLMLTAARNAVADGSGEQGLEDETKQANNLTYILPIVFGSLAVVVAVVIFCCCCTSSGEDGADVDAHGMRRQGSSSSKISPSTTGPHSRPLKMTTGASSSTLGSLTEGILAPVGSKPKSASQPKLRQNISPAPIPLAKKGASRGLCTRCGKDVYETEERQKDENGGYFHTSPANCEVLARVQRGSIILDGVGS